MDFVTIFGIQMSPGTQGLYHINDHDMFLNQCSQSATLNVQTLEKNISSAHFIHT